MLDIFSNILWKWDIVCYCQEILDMFTCESLLSVGLDLTLIMS